METRFPEALRQTSAGQTAEQILRTCVHCGFCNATCPTYQLLGDELEGPRGRIYQMKQALEGTRISTRTLDHLDRCLQCRSCETTCPSGVKYNALLEIARPLIIERVGRSWQQRGLRALLRWAVPDARRFHRLLTLAQRLKPLLPKSRRGLLPRPAAPQVWQGRSLTRKVVLLDGCAQAATAPEINRAAGQVLDRLGIQVVPTPATGCCGLLSHHLDDTAAAKSHARRVIDAWWPLLEEGLEAAVMTASACGGFIKDYSKLFHDDPVYFDRAHKLARITQDLSEFLARQDLTSLGQPGAGRELAFHAPCTLQHHQGLTGRVEGLLVGLGFHLQPVADSHLCCGAAGSYALLQHELSQRLLSNKIAALHAAKPAVIASANIGCILHLRQAAEPMVVHWIQLLVD